jgi:hypothetical protein
VACKRRRPEKVELKLKPSLRPCVHARTIELSPHSPVCDRRGYRISRPPPPTIHSRHHAVNDRGRLEEVVPRAASQ